MSAVSFVKPCQSWFRSANCTETALILVADLLLAMDKGRTSILILLDLSVLFDTISHRLFLSHLQEAAGMKGDTLKWYISFLSIWIQRVIMDNCSSISRDLTVKVPQGSDLSLILLILCVELLWQLVRQCGPAEHPAYNKCQQHNDRWTLSCNILNKPFGNKIKFIELNNQIRINTLGVLCIKNAVVLC